MVVGSLSSGIDVIPRGVSTTGLPAMVRFMGVAGGDWEGWWRNDMSSPGGSSRPAASSSTSNVEFRAFGANSCSSNPMGWALE